MKRYLHVLLILVGLLIGGFFFHGGWWEVLGFLLLLSFCIWNVFAFLNDRDMVSPPKMTSDITTNGDMSARQFLFGLSLFFFLLLTSGWIWRYFHLID